MARRDRVFGFGVSFLIALAIALVQPSRLSAEDLAPRSMWGHTGEVFVVAYAPNGRLIASGGGDHSIRLWDPATGRDMGVLRGHLGMVRGLAFSPDSRFLASGSADTTIRIWDVGTGKEVRAVRSSFGAVRAVAFSPDAKTIATVGDDSSLRVWEAETGKALKAVRGQFGIVYSVGFSTDGRILATGSSDARVHLWDLATGMERTALSGHGGAVHAIAFSPDSRWLASASADQEIRLWDLAAGRERTVFAGHKGEIYALVFSADGRSLISGGADGTVRVWDVATGHERQALTGHKGPVWSLALSPDGAMIVSGGRDRTVRLQPATPPVTSGSLAAKIKERGDEVGPPPSPPPLPEADLIIQPTEVKAGEVVTLTVVVKNKGKGPLYRVQAKTNSSDPAFNGHVFYLGKVDAGTTARDAITVKTSQDRAEENVSMRLEFEEYNGFVPDVVKAVIAMKGLPRPRFAYTYQVLDDGTGSSVGNGDGRIQKGEAVDLLLTVKNVGSVTAQKTSAEVTLAGGHGIRLEQGKVEFGALQPDETKSARINLFVGRDVQDASVPLRVFIREHGSRVFLDEPVTLSLDHQPPPQIMVTNKLVAVGPPSAKIHSGAGSETSVIASAPKGQSLAVTGELGSWYRIQISDTETGWIPKSDVAEGVEPVKGDMPVPIITGGPVVKLFQKAPPIIALATPPDGAQVNTDRITVMGAAASEKGIARVEFRVNGRVQAQRDSRGVVVMPSAETNHEFSERLVLQEGRNEIVITAVDQENLSASRTVTVTRTADRGKIWAVVIGISQYQTVHPLRYAHKDALAFHDYLINQVGVPKENTTLLINDQATLVNLKRTLGTELKRKAGEKDTVIVYYAGHGAPEADASAGDDDGMEKYIVPYDADPRDLYTTGLPMREVETIFQRLAPERVIFITDSCYSGATAGRTFATAARRAVVSETFLSRLSKGKGRIVLTASKASEVSEEREALEHGVFTYYLLEGLRGKADLDSDGMITVDEVYSYVSKKVPEATGQNQHPVKKGEVEGQLVLGYQQK